VVRPGPSGSDDAATVERLRRLGVDDVIVLDTGGPADQITGMAAALDGRTLIVAGDLLVADASLGQLVDDPAVRSGALLDDAIARRAERPASPATVRVVQRRIASAGSAAHGVSGPTGAFLGALVVDAADVPRAREILTAAAETARIAGWDREPDADAVDVALVALVRGQVPMAAVGSVGPVLRDGTVEQRAAVAAELADLDQARVLLERANRPDDGFYSTFVLRRASKPVTTLALRLGLTPNQVSMLSLAVGLAAAGCFAQGGWWWLLAGALLLQASLVVDCVDGEVARFTRAFSDLGAWLDASTDRVKEYAAYAGLAAGSARSGVDIWWLAALVMIMQTVRHVGDYDFSRVQRIRESWVPARDLADPSDGGQGDAGATLALSAQLNRNSRIRWAKKVLHMPIGERWLVLSVGAVLLGPKWTLLALLGLGLVALAYTTTGRVLRARRWTHPADRSGEHLLAPQLDLGPLGEPVWRSTLGRRSPLAGAFGWAWPAGMRVVELGAAWLAVMVVAPGSTAWLFGWAFVVAFHHYDTLYRALGGAAPPRWLVWTGLGWDGRTILVLATALLGAGSLAGLLRWGTPILAALFVVVASMQWVVSLRRKDGTHV
jgi:phosphatidylglycerophosphate synthase